MKILNFYFLDRNVIGTIETIIKGKQPHNEEWKSRRKRLKAIDKKKNVVASLLSSMEGANSFNETSEDKIKTIVKEAELIKKFFKLAKNDADVNVKLANSISVLNFGKHEYGFDNYIKFYKEVSPILLQSVSPTNYLKTEDKLIEIAKNHNVSVTHPVFLCVLSVMYGNKSAREVLKFRENPTNEMAYNALSDILLISRIPHVTYAIKTSGIQEWQDCKVKFITFDKNLRKIYDYFTATGVQVSPHDKSTVKTEICVNLNPKMFPELTEKDVISLINRIKINAVNSM